MQSQNSSCDCDFFDEAANCWEFGIDCLSSLCENVFLPCRSKDQPDVNVSGEEIDKCSLNVEGEMYSFFGDTGHRYKNKYRSLMFNLKDPRNKVRDLV